VLDLLPRSPAPPTSPSAAIAPTSAAATLGAACAAGAKGARIGDDRPPSFGSETLQVAALEDVIRSNRPPSGQESCRTPILAETLAVRTRLDAKAKGKSQ